MFQTKVVEKIKAHILCSITFSRKSWRLWDNVEKYGTARQVTDNNIIRRMRFACWVTKATDTNSEYVILIDFPGQQWLRERASMSRYMHIACLVNTFFLFTKSLLPYFSKKHVSPPGRSCCPSAAISERRSAVPRHPCNGVLPNPLSKEQRDE
jgi:hypothetical protein